MVPLTMILGGPIKRHTFQLQFTVASLIFRFTSCQYIAQMCITA